MSDPKKRYISKTEFAQYMGVNRSQVTRAVKSGRINETKSGRIDWKQAREAWEDNRSDNLSGTGRANNRKKKTPLFDAVPSVPHVIEIKDVGDMDDLDNDPSAPKTYINTDEVGKPPKKGTRAHAEYRERLAKAEWAEMKVRKEKGELLEKNDVIAVYGATLNGLKTGVLSMPQRTTMKIMGALKEWLAANDVHVDVNKFVFLEKNFEQVITSEAHFVLTDILHKLEHVEQEADQIAEKRR